MKCLNCKKSARQFMADSKGNLTRRYFRCDKCKSVFIEYVYVPFAYGINGKVELENVIGDVAGLKERQVFKVEEIKHKPKTFQSTLI